MLEKLLNLKFRRKFSANVREKIDRNNTRLTNSLFEDISNANMESWNLLGANTVDQSLKNDKEHSNIGEQFKDDLSTFVKTVMRAWQKLANFDR